jgi:hypothetical protein
MILQKLSITNQNPPGGFRFTVPENGYQMSGFHTMADLLGAVKRHYDDNNIPLPDNWQDLVENQLCQKMPAGWCHYIDGTPAQGITPVLSFENILKGITSLSKMAMEAVKGEDVYVDQNEAERRADICSRCYYNMNASFCMGCGGARVILDLVGEVRGSRTTTKDYMLQNCGVCGCRNDAIVHVKKNILLSGENSDTTNKRPNWCWLKNDSLDEAQSQLHL